MTLPQEQPAQCWDPLLYQNAAAFVPAFGGPLIDILAPRPGERILDLGCGTGELTQAIADKGPEVIGMDAAANMVEQARAQFPLRAFCVGDAQDMTFTEEFDAVFSNAALHWMPRAAAVAGGVARALRPGGRFVAELGGAGNVAVVRGAMHDVLQDHGLENQRMPPWFFPSVAEYARVLEDAGFRVRLIQWFERPTRMAGELGLRTWLALFCGPLLSSLGHRQAEIMTDVEVRCRPSLFRDGDWWIDYTRLRVVATRA